MPLINFSRASEVTNCVKYLGEFGDTLKFTLCTQGYRSTLRVSCVDIPPFSYTEVMFESFSPTPSKRQSLEDEKSVWAVNSSFLRNVLTCFNDRLGLRIQFTEDSNELTLYQSSGEHLGENDDDDDKENNNNAECLRVVRIGVLFDLGPNLSVHHDVTILYGINDILGFHQVARTACANDEQNCSLSLQWEDGYDTCYLVVKTDTVRSSIQLGSLSTQASAKNYEGCARCTDLRAFAALGVAERIHAPKLCIGFGDGGLALLQLKWCSEEGQRNAELFFCSS